MEHAWIVSKDDEVEAVLEHPGLHVRPPGLQVPPEMEGTLLGDVFARLVRMNEGARHAELRALASGIIAGWDLGRITGLAREASKSMEPRDVGAFVVATMIGLERPHEAMPLIRDFAGAVAGGASAEAIARGVAAAPQLLERLPGHGDGDERANVLGFLFQTYAAVGTMIENRVHGCAVPPVVMTRRWAACDLELFGATLKRGDALVVLLTSPKFTFGAGRHRCPGETVVSAIVDGTRITRT